VPAPGSSQAAPPRDAGQGRGPPQSPHTPRGATMRRTWGLLLALLLPGCGVPGMSAGTAAALQHGGGGRRRLGDGCFLDRYRGLSVSAAAAQGVDLTTQFEHPTSVGSVLFDLCAVSLVRVLVGA
jgi:hypothetical protein